ncbi:MAG: 1,4-alpha-glucan branching protein GlgB [Spongiibacteraceae bacterium]
MHRIRLGQHHDPFEILGWHGADAQQLLRVFLPDALSAQVMIGSQYVELVPTAEAGFYELHATVLHSGVLHDTALQNTAVPVHYSIRWIDRQGQTHIEIDPYTFAPQIADFDLHLFAEGKHWHIYQLLGAHVRCIDGIDGVLFATWAPNAQRISVIGDFNGWDGRRHAMRSRGGSGVWELFIPGIVRADNGSDFQFIAGANYKFEIRSRDGGVQQKADPYGNAFEVRPQTAAQITAPSQYQWRDGEWMTQRAQRDWLHAPLSVYEVHLGSWQRDTHGNFLNYRELAHRLVDYIVPLGFTHIELLPITEHPLDDSWGYQTTGYYAPTSRFGSPDDFRYFVDHCHANGIGVLLDWVPAHFPKDTHALARFDGTALYEHEDPRRGEHRDWGTLIYNFGRNEVKNFLLANANFWLEEFHLDGLRVDAVASMLYLDYSREPGDWVPNIHGGRENLEAMAFLRELNEMTHGRHPGTLVIAEESTAWPQVTRPTWVGGLGFSMKWNMGWMHDTLNYLSKDPIHRHYHHDQLTFGLMYAFSENFVLPFSHDEVVHGKRSLLDKMPGDRWQKFANLRLLLTYMFTYPGAKLLFMGGEFGQWREWSHNRALDWHLLDEYAAESGDHRGLKKLIGDLNHLYRSETSLHRYSFEQHGFAWIDCHDATQSTLSYLRLSDDDCTVIVCNFTPVPRRYFKIGVPRSGNYRELLNSDSMYYGGSNVGNGVLHTTDESWMQQPYALSLTLPPLGAVVLKWAAH